MAQQFYQPQRRPRLDDQRGVYDDEPLPDSVNDQSAQVSQGAQNTLDNIDDVLRDAESNPRSGAGSNGDDSAGNAGDNASPTGKGKEKEGENGADTEGDQVGKGFTPSDVPTTKKDAAKLLIDKNKRKALFGGGALGIVIALIFLFFLFLIPLKIEHMVQNLQNHFFASSENAITNQTDALFAKYITERVLPGYSKCGSTIDRHCSALSTAGSNPVDRLFNNWRTQRFENKLADKYGIEFASHADGTWSITAPGLGDENIGKDGERLTQTFKTSAEFRAAANDVVSEQTGWKSVFYRFKVGGLLHAKYKEARCVVFCKLVDPLHDNIKAQQRTFQLFLNDKVIMPRDEALGTAIACLLNPDCDPTKADNTSPNDAESGQPQSEVAQSVDNELGDATSALGTSEAEEAATLLANYEELESKGIQKVIITRVLASLGVDITENATANTALDKIPYIGWVNMIAQLINAGNGAGPKIKALEYLTNAPAEVKEWGMFRSFVDEMHTGHVTATETGSMVDALSGGDSTVAGAAEKQVGGTAGAENTPLYADLVDGETNAKSSTYICKNDKPVAKDKKVCDEEVLAGGNAIANNVHDFLHLPGVSILTVVAHYWGDVSGVVNKIISLPLKAYSDVASKTCGLPGGSIFGNLFFPGYCASQKAIAALEPAIIKGVTQYLIPNPFGATMSGGRTFDLVAAGADVSGNDVAHTTLGAQVVTGAQHAQIVNEQTQLAKESFDRQPLFARLFSTTSQYSLVSRIALDMPTGKQSLLSAGYATLTTNPFASLFHGFSSIFSSTSVFADSSSTDDPFGVVQYGYPAGTIPDDPGQYWDQHCSDNQAHAFQSDADWNNPATNWDQQAAHSLDSGTQQPTNKTTNPCLLIEATVGSLGGKDDSSLLTSDDLAQTGGGGN